MTTQGFDDDFYGNKDKGCYYYWLVYSFGETALEYKSNYMRYMASYRFERANGKRYWKTVIFVKFHLSKVAIKQLVGKEVNAIPVSKEYARSMKVLKIGADKLITNPLFAKIHGSLFKGGNKALSKAKIEFSTPIIHEAFLNNSFVVKQ